MGVVCLTKEFCRTGMYFKKHEVCTTQLFMLRSAEFSRNQTMCSSGQHVCQTACCFTRRPINNKVWWSSDVKRQIIVLWDRGTVHAILCYLPQVGLSATNCFKSARSTTYCRHINKWNCMAVTRRGDRNAKPTTLRTVIFLADRSFARHRMGSLARKPMNLKV